MKKHTLISFLALFAFAAMLPSFASAKIASGSNWCVTGAGDFNRGLTADISWGNRANGAALVRCRNEREAVAEHNTETIPDSSRSVTEGGEFYGDGSPDVLWVNLSSGITRIRCPDEYTVIDQETVAMMAEPWSIVGAGDFNNDGSPDILWRNPVTGEAVVWLMHGTHVRDVPTISAPVPPWEIICLESFNGDGNPVAVWPYVETVSNSYPQWTTPLRTRLAGNSLSIRAPPIFPVIS